MDNSNKTGFLRKHPVLANFFIIALITVISLMIVYFSLAIFTKHGRSDVVPSVENMSYYQAIDKLHEAGLLYEIRDSLYREDVKPGYVLEQFPKAGSVVKPGRKVFLYINTLYPKEVIIDEENRPMEYALENLSLRQAMAKLEELGFKKIRVVKILGDNELVAKVLANGVAVRKMQKVPITSSIVLEVYDGRLSLLRDSLQNLENSNRFVGEEIENLVEEYNRNNQPSEPENKEEEEPEFLD